MKQQSDTSLSIETNSIDILYKISPVSYIKEILAGSLYMKSLSYFRTLEVEGKGDDKEGSLCEKAKGKVFVTLNGKQELLATADNVSAWVNSQNPIFCFSHTTLECTNEGIYRLKIPSLHARDYKFKEVAYN